MRLNPTEYEEQVSLFEWAFVMRKQYPELKLMHHVPNGGKRSKSEAARFQREGVKAGVPDICLPVPRGEHHGLYIEMKRRQGGKVSDLQQQWLDDLNAQGYLAVVCKGCNEAETVIEQYLNEK